MTAPQRAPDHWRRRAAIGQNRGVPTTNTLSARLALVLLLAAGTAGAAAGCGGGGGGGKPDGAAGAGGSVAPSAVIISTATRKPRTTTASVNYWQWAPAYGDYVTGTETLVAALAPALLRVGGYNNDANTPNAFDDAKLDAMVAYARAVGAEPILQVPLLANASGQPATADDAAAMIQYANVTKGYGIKYVSIGNEPDLYDTQGLPSDSTKPAIPGFGPSDFCASATSYVTAMKSVDPTLRIVGPDLAYKYQAGNGSYDWLTPILQGCGALFDVVSIHRYPFEAKQATLSAASADAMAFRSVIGSVKGILQASGQGQKPLALTEMNIAYDATACVLDASPGTVGSALWLADILGAATTLDLWTSAVWDIADTEAWSLGLIGAPPSHQPRPEYYAYLLWAEHFGPTLLTGTSAPARVSVYASRNAADDTTQAIVVNWNTTETALEFQVTGLSAPPPAATFVVPATSITAIAIPDLPGATAWTYGEFQRLAGEGPQPLAQQGAPAPHGDDGGTDGGGTGGAAGAAGRAVGDGCQADGGPRCAEVTPVAAAITTMGAMSGANLSFGPSGEKWGSYVYAGSGQTPPTGTVTPDGTGIEIAGGFLPGVTASSNYMGLGLYFSSSSCLDASAYQGVKFDFSGDLGGCQLALGASWSGNLATAADATRGGCAGTNSTCYGPSADVTPDALAVTTDAPTIKVPFTSLAGGMPNDKLDPTTLVDVQWQLSSPAGAEAYGCNASFTVANVSLY